MNPLTIAIARKIRSENMPHIVNRLCDLLEARCVIPEIMDETQATALVNEYLKVRQEHTEYTVRSAYHHALARLY